MFSQFLIHSDFVTQANRQDIVTSSARNAGLVGEIASAFVKAVSRFCEHSTLQYQWMRYLPQEKEYPWDPFGKQLVDGIKSILEFKEVLRPRSHGDLRCIGDMRRLLDTMVDGNGEPLFDDVDPERYLASDYLFEDLDRLEEYGLEYMDIGEAIMRVQKDLDRPSGSRMKSSMTDEDWHSRTAKALGLPFHERRTSIFRSRVRSLSLLPLTSGEWVSTCGRIVYYSHINGALIPKDLDLYLVDPHASENAERRQLFDYLGVQEPPPHLVRDRIMAKYNCTEIPANIDLVTSRNHLTFLYLTDHLDDRPDFHTENLRIFNHRDGFQRPAVHNFYIADDHPYGPQELFRPISHGIDPDAGAPGLDVSFVHPEYMNNSPQPPNGQDLRWATWFNKSLSIRELVRLTKIHGQGLSEECLYVARYRPEKFLGFLSEYWKVDGSLIAESHLLDQLLQTKVLCKGNHMHPLRGTYLPTAELQRRSLRFLEDDNFFPWLKFEVPLSHEVRPLEWETLMNALGIGYPSDLHFCLAILRFILDKHHENPSAISFTQASRLCKLYESIQAKYNDFVGSVDHSSCLQMIQYEPATYSRNDF
jgi:hypothetical protein